LRSSTTPCTSSGKSPLRILARRRRDKDRLRDAEKLRTVRALQRDAAPLADRGGVVRLQRKVPQRARARLAAVVARHLPVEAAIGRRKTRIGQIDVERRRAVRIDAHLRGDGSDDLRQFVGGAPLDLIVEDRTQAERRQRQAQHDEHRRRSAEPDEQRASPHERSSAMR
jgi:hypothetical protein